MNQPLASSSQILKSSLIMKAIEDAKILICAGAGGVGKTTLAAVLGIVSALNGKRTVVITIDPAKRLADALGLSKLGNTPREISQEVLQKAGFELPKGASLSAMMLDLQSTWDSLIERYSTSDTQKQAIFSNPFYRRLSSTLAGSYEYMAMEKLYELHESGNYDVIILDTPPSVHALDFLDAPQKLLDVLNNQAMKLFTMPYELSEKAGIRLLSLTNTMIMKRLAQFTGTELLKQLAEFLATFEGMYDGFKKRAENVSSLLESEVTSFLLITTPTDGACEEAQLFYSELKKRKLRFCALVVNKMHPKAEAPHSPLIVNQLKKEFTKQLELEGLRGEAGDFWALLLSNALYSESLWRRDLERINTLKKSCCEYNENRIFGVQRFPISLSRVEALKALSENLLNANIL